MQKHWTSHLFGYSNRMKQKIQSIIDMEAAWWTMTVHEEEMFGNLIQTVTAAESYTGSICRKYSSLLSEYDMLGSGLLEVARL